MNTPEFLFHYYEKANGPFRNLTENGSEKANEIQQQIKTGANSKRPPNYVDLRMSLEKRLKQEFIRKGGNPNRNDPFYFTLGECKWLETWYEEPEVIKIPVDELMEPLQISFTYPDSMVSFQFHDEPKLAAYRKEANGKVFLLGELTQLIETHGLPDEKKWTAVESCKYDRYIEAQLWDDKLIRPYL